MAEKTGRFFVISGPSGAGKTTIVNEALSRLAKDIEISRVVTYTSRPPREGEVNGRDYVFISGDEFKQKISDKFFLETVEYAGHAYGSPLPPKEEMELGKSFILIVELEGAKRAVKEIDQGLSVWIETPGLGVLRERLEKRGTESTEQIEKRIARAEEETKEAHKIRIFDYNLVNDDFEQAVREFIMLIKKAFE